MGDFLNCIYEYFHTCENLKKIGYNDFSIKFSLNKNVYLHKDSFFDFFKKETFETIFNSIEIIDEPIVSVKYGDMERIISIGNADPGAHLWDLFVEDGYDENVKNAFKQYSYKKPEIPYIDFFNDNINEKYQNLKKEYGLDDYVSIYYRTYDLQDNEDTYVNFESEFDEIIRNNDKIYVSSNAYLFKEYVKKYGDKIVMYDIPGEDVAGNHYNYNRVFYDNKDMIHLRTEFVLFEMLTLSDSKEVNFFTLWGRESNFLLLTKVKETPIITK
jgi:hypothetical protein